MQRSLVLLILVHAAAGCGLGTDGGTEPPDGPLIPFTLAYGSETTSFFGVGGTSSEDVFAVGWDYTRSPTAVIAHWDGTAWETMDAGVDAALVSVWAVAPDDVYAVGWHQSGDPSEPSTAYVLHYDGSDWTTSGSTRGTGFTDVWIAPSGAVFVTGWSGTVYRHDGVDWSLMNTGTTADLTGVVGAGADDVYAVGTSGTGAVQEAVILRWDGTAWSEAVSYNNAQFDGVTRTPDGVLYAVGRESGSFPHVVIVRNDGSGWTPMRFSAGGWLRDVWAFAADDVLAVGAKSFGAAVIYHYDGTEWTQVQTELDLGLGFDGIWGAVPDRLWAVGGVGVFRGDR